MRKFGIATALVGVAALTLAASPVGAATLPESDAIYILPCDSDVYDGILYQVDSTTGVATRIGDWVNPDENVYSCAGPGAYDPTSGLGYWISWAEDSTGYLIQVDLTTGVNTLIGEFTLEGEPYYTPIALTIDAAGNAWGTSWGSSPDELFSVNLATAELTVVGPTGVSPESGNYGLAWDAVTNAVYAYNVDTEDFYTVNTATGAFTVFATDVLSDIRPYAIAFDSAGQVWGINQDLISAPLGDLVNFEVVTVVNPYADPEAEGDIYSESIIIAPAPAPQPQLAATGLESNTGMLVGVGVLLVLVGAVVARRKAA